LGVHKPARKREVGGKQAEGEVRKSNLEPWSPLVPALVLLQDRTGRGVLSPGPQPEAICMVVFSSDCCVPLVGTTIWSLPGSQALSPSREWKQNHPEKVLTPNPYLCDSFYFL